MKLASSRLLNGALASLLVSAVAVACGSSSERRVEPTAEGGAGGLGGAGGEPASVQAGAGTVPELVGGVGGEPIAQGGGPSGNAGVPPVLEGGAPPSMAGTGAGGEGGDTPLPLIDCSTITFADPGLTAAVLDELEKGASDVITTAEAAGILGLNAQGYGIASLAGIECLTGLTDARFGIGGAASQITNLAPLRYLKALTTLDLSQNPLGDLSPLAELPELQELNLFRALMGNDLSPLANAPSLEELNLVQTSVGDLSPLGEIATLVSLDLRGATLTQPASLASLTNLSQLFVSNALSDATPLGGLTQLTVLDVSDKLLTNHDALVTLVNLTNLQARGAGMTNATPLVGMSKLVNLELDNNQIADVSPLTNLIQLSTLSLMNNTFTNLTPLVNNTGLATGDSIRLTGVPLSCSTEKPKLAALRDRGVNLIGAQTCP